MEAIGSAVRAATERGRLLGTVVALQVQGSAIKHGHGAFEEYDPSGLTAVATLLLDDGGVVGCPSSGGLILDVHHRDHPQSRNRRGENGFSFGATAHYAAMRERFGAHLIDGCAGENIVVQTEGMVRLEDLHGGVVILCSDGRTIALDGLCVAEPCVPFTRYALRYPSGVRADRTVTEALTFLRNGMRGFYAAYHGGEPVSIGPGDRLYLAASATEGSAGPPITTGC